MTNDELREQIAQDIENLYLKAKEAYPEVDGVSQMPKDVRKAYLDALLTIRRA